MQKLSESVGGRIQIASAKGRPPYEYELVYNVRSVTGVSSDHPLYGTSHRVRIKLPSNYPIGQPYAEMLTPLFHPHVFPSTVICIGRQWMPSEFLDLFVKRVGSIICFDPDYFDFTSPANRTAMDWAKHNMNLFPTDTLEVKKSKPGVQWKEVKKVTWKNT